MGIKSDTVMGKFIPISLACLTLCITPWYNFDSVSLPKFVLLVGVGLASWYFIFANRRTLFSNSHRPISVIQTSFVLWLFFVLLINGNSNIPELFGTQGRNTGFLTYFSFTGILLLTFSAYNSRLNQRILRALFFVGCTNLIYGLLQFFGYDPFKWNNPYSPIVGTLGNPNFISSLLGLFGVLLFSRLLQARSKELVIQGVLLVLSAWLIVKSDSVQGLFVLGIGIFVLIVLFYLKEIKSYLISMFFLFLGLMFISLTIVGLAGIGPLSTLTSNGTVIYRVDYWLAGLRMAWNNPILGVGIDGYGDYYREYRSLEAAIRRGPDFVTDASHNVFIDLFVSGGLPLLLLYCTTVFLVIRAILRIIRQTNEYESSTFGLVALWIGHLAQSLISINQIGLAVWFWALSGAILGRENSLRLQLEKQKSKVVESSFAFHSMAASCFALIGLILATPALIKDHHYRMALESREVNRISEVTYRYPRDSFYFNRTMLLYKDNNLINEILPLARQSIADNPRNYWGWRLLAEYGSTDSLERMKAIKMTIMLDPHNPNNPK